jgi:aspartate carbamoyltransferase catalytic subunit
LDIFTIREKLGRIEGVKVLIVGDILHSRVARSNIWGLTKLGAEVRVAGPATLIPPQIERLGVKVCYQINDVIGDVDVIYMLRIQLERQRERLFPSLREYTKLYGIDMARLRLAKPDVLIMHPGPMNRGVEISSEVADSMSSVIYEQVTNGIAVRMAILYLLGRGRGR